MLVLWMGVVLAGGAAAAACSDGDPRFGPPEAIRGRKIDYGVDVPAPEISEEGGSSSGGTRSPQQLFDDVYATIQGVGEGTKCTPCHEPGGTGVTLFVGTSAADSYAIFKSKGYQDITKPNTFATKGQHSGNPLTPAQQALTKKWSEAEGAGTATDAGAD
jgi:hypothetical protein